MGRVKDYFWEEICSEEYGNAMDGPDPDDLETMRIDAEMSRDRYLRALEKKRETDGKSYDKSF